MNERRQRNLQGAEGNTSKGAIADMQNGWNRPKSTVIAQHILSSKVHHFKGGIKYKIQDLFSKQKSKIYGGGQDCQNL